MLLVDSGETDSMALVDDPVHLAASQQLTQAQAFPNPFTDQFNIKLPESIEGNVQLTLFGPGGQIRYRYQGENNIPQILANANWPTGVYWVTLQYDDKRETIRLLKM